MKTNTDKQTDVICVNEENAACRAANLILSMQIPAKALPKLRDKYGVKLRDGATYGEMLEAKAMSFGWKKQ